MKVALRLGEMIGLGTRGLCRECPGHHLCVAYLSIIVALLALASCERLSSDGCNGVMDCFASTNGIVLGGDAPMRLAAARDLDSAAAAYSAWFDRKAPPDGLIILDEQSRLSSKLVDTKAWTLDYARSANNGGEGSRPENRSGAKGAASESPFAISETSSEFDVARPGVLAHEICHRHASRAFEQAWGTARDFPHMLDEVAAISCESESMKDERLRQFARSFAKGDFIPWRTFLATGHPLKDDATLKAMSRLARPGSGTVTFDIRPGSAYGLKLALFYSQAAAFGAFLKARSCRGMQVLGHLLSTYDQQKGLDRWLRSNGSRFCLPSSLEAFETAFSNYAGTIEIPAPSA